MEMNPNEFKIVNVHSGEEKFAFNEATDDLYGVGYFFKHYINGKIFGIGLCLESEGWKRAEEGMQFKVGDRVKHKGGIDEIICSTTNKPAHFVVKEINDPSEDKFELVIFCSSCEKEFYTFFSKFELIDKQKQEQPMKFEIYDESKVK